MENQYLRTRENYNSNNYDLILLSDVPPNIKREDSEDILKEVSDLFPATKKIHLVSKVDKRVFSHSYIITTKIKMKGVK